MPRWTLTPEEDRRSQAIFEGREPMTDAAELVKRLRSEADLWREPDVASAGPGIAELLTEAAAALAAQQDGVRELASYFHQGLVNDNARYLTALHGVLRLDGTHDLIDAKKLAEAAINGS